MDLARAEQPDWDQTNLRFHLVCDNWGVDEAMKIFAANEVFGGQILFDKKVRENLQLIFDSSPRFRDPCEDYSPKGFIDWVMTKHFRPMWLDWAIERGLYTPKQAAGEATRPEAAQPVFDKTNPAYPPELDVALQAWQAVSATEGKGKPKARIKAWLDSNTKLSSEAKERIATVANWDKTGGATRTD